MSIVGVELDTPEVSSEAESNFRPNMVVVGIGGGGGNAVSHMVKAHIDAVKTICINTDAQALNKTFASHYIEYSDWYRESDRDPRNTQNVLNGEDYQ